MIQGIGVDTVDIERFAGQLARTPALRQRLFTEHERDLHITSLAARFAAKEALIKALGGSGSLTWHDIEITKDDLGKPSFVPHQTLLAEMRERGGTDVHLSLTHDGGIATAFVVMEKRTIQHDALDAVSLREKPL